MISAVSHIFSVTIVVKVQNSSDLDRGRRPELKSDEFSRWIAMVVKILTILVEIARR